MISQSCFYKRMKVSPVAALGNSPRLKLRLSAFFRRSSGRRSLCFFVVSLKKQNSRETRFADVQTSIRSQTSLETHVKPFFLSIFAGNDLHMKLFVSAE